jgi:sarcosine oxidase subunit alpha
MQKNRIDQISEINKEKVLTFSFNGKKMQGYQGDTLASALLANDIKIVGRSFKYHRPRGIVASGAEEPNAIFQVGLGAKTEAGLKATQVDLYDGLIATSKKGWPSINFDIGVINDLMSKAFGAGFYYKTFMYPAKFWKFYEFFLRKLSGFGSAPDQKDPDNYDHKNIHCDLLIVGAGPAGLMSALCSAQTGAKVVIVDEKDRFGGKLLSSSEKINNIPAPEWAKNTQAILENSPNVTCLKRSTAFGYYDYNFITVCQHFNDHDTNHNLNQVRQRLWRVRAKQVILAQGAFERPLVFSNNDRPGVMLASAVSEYVKRFAVLPGRNIAVFTNNDSAYQTAIDLKQAGISDLVIIDSRKNNNSNAYRDVSSLGIEVKFNTAVINVRGKKHIESIDLASINEATGIHDKEITQRKCDLLVYSGGWSPAVHLHSQSGGKNEWSNDLHCFIPKKSNQECESVGSCNGKWSLKDCLEDGFEKTKILLTNLEFDAPNMPLPEVEEKKYFSLSPLWRVRSDVEPELIPKQFIDFQNDTSVTDIFLAVREGYENIEHVKRYTALGFGTDQGKLGNINGMAILGEVLGKPISEIGTTTFRPAYTPVSFGVCAGQDIGKFFDPIRKTAIHDFHDRLNVPFELVGQWLRPWYFPQSKETLSASVHRESLAARNSLGIMDASTLGKIDVRGKDAITFLERIYTHDIASMSIGKCAYGLILGEDGMIKDDGVMARLDENHFYITTTTGGAATVLSWLEQWLQTEWPELDVYLTSLTDHLSTIVLAGPNSRKLLQKMGAKGIDPGELPFMHTTRTSINDLDVDIFRVSFSGELAFEINVNSNSALSLWQAFMEHGKEYNITPYGTETMHVLRAEKGFIIVGQDTDGSVSPVDAGLGWMLSKNKDFIGKRSLSRKDSNKKNRKQLVGLYSVDKKSVVSEGSQLIKNKNKGDPVPMFGHVSSSYFSPILNQPIALALLENGRNRFDERLIAVSSDENEIEVIVTNPCFYDSKGERQNV